MPKQMEGNTFSLSTTGGGRELCPGKPLVWLDQDGGEGTPSSGLVRTRECPKVPSSMLGQDGGRGTPGYPPPLVGLGQDEGREVSTGVPLNGGWGVGTPVE